MIRTFFTASFLVFLALPSFAQTTFQRTAKSAEDYLADTQLTSKLTRLRDVGGTTPRRATACISFEKYEEYLRASWGDSLFEPTKDKCWPTEYDQSVKATGNCRHASSSALTDSSYKTLVCEFETDGWFSSNVWISEVAVVPK